MDQISTNQPQVNFKSFKADHIKHGHIADDHIADIPIEKVYEWIKTNKWKQKDFIRWLKVLRVVE